MNKQYESTDFHMKCKCTEKYTENKKWNGEQQGVQLFLQCIIIGKEGTEAAVTVLLNPVPGGPFITETQPESWKLVSHLPAVGVLFVSLQ